MSRPATMPWLGGGTSDRKSARLLERARFTGLPIDWDAVVGHEHAKRELRVVAAALTRRDLAERLGVPLVKGIVMTGPPGTGKTLLARAFASTVDRPVFVLSAAELTAGRIRRIYDILADIPSVVVIDEIDIVARRAYGRTDRSTTVGALCVALDGVWRSVRSEVAAAEAACRAVLGSQTAAIDRLARALEEAGTLSGARLIEVLRAVGAQEGPDGVRPAAAPGPVR